MECGNAWFIECDMCCMCVGECTEYCSDELLCDMIRCNPEMRDVEDIQDVWRVRVVDLAADSTAHSRADPSASVYLMVSLCSSFMQSVTVPLSTRLTHQSTSFATASAGSTSCTSLSGMLVE